MTARTKGMPVTTTATRRPASKTAVPQQGSGRMGRRLGRFPGVAPAAAMVLLLLIWEALVRVFAVPDYLLPTPTSIAVATVDNWPLLMEHTWVTLVETLLGFLVSVVVGLAFALFMVMWPVLGSALLPLLVASQVIPKIAIAPLMVVWIGTGMATSSLIAFVMAFFPVVVNATLGLKSVDEGSLHMLQSMRATKWQQFRYMRFPTALPHILSGMQLAIAFAIVGAIVGEFVGSNSGLGYLLIVAQGNLQTELLFADLVILTVLGLVLYYGVELLGRLIVRRR